MSGSLDYQCEVYESGYEMIYACEEEKPEEEYKPYPKPIDPHSAKRIFNLSEYPGAYLEFVITYFDITDHRKDEDFYFINFVNKYGLLTRPSSNIEADAGTAYIHMLMMAVAVRAFRCLLDVNKEKLNKLFVKVGEKFKIQIDDKSILKADIPDILTIGQTTPRNSSEAAYHYICNVVNENLKDSLATEIIVNPHNTGVDMIVRPKDLISALWLQFANVVSRNLEFKQCAACSTFFEVKSKKRKDQKKYCSTRCRVRVGAVDRRNREKLKAEEKRRTEEKAK